MKCFYHLRDMDGRCSGAIVKMMHPECELIGYDYGLPFPWDTIQPDEVVYMVDISLQPFSDMLRLRGACGSLVWVDHHIGAINDRDAMGEPFSGLQIDGQAGCELTWKLLVDSNSPHAVFLLGRYDVWDWMNHDGAMEFQTAMWQFDTDPNNVEFWFRLFHDDILVEEIIEKGALLLAARKKDNSIRIKSLSFNTMLGEYRVLAVNHGMTNSTIFDGAYNPEQHDIMVSFCWYRTHWKVSVYVDKDRPDIDASVICKKFGGGGHKGASGFQCDVLPFKLVSP
jgi:oligoribonuclease NrnB/cAMP/cGMP phosphodiesterase (DHH superfamily)